MEKIGFYIAKMIRRLHRPAIRSSSIHKTSKICSGSQINYTTVGRYSYIGNNCLVNHLKLGAFCSISDSCFIGGSAHPMDFVSTSPVFCKGHNILGKNFSKKEFEPTKETVIANDVWIGSGAIILAGRKIGNGAVIGAGSVVTKDIGDYEIWAGNPARFIRKRFPDEIIAGLKELSWWDWSDEEISSMSEYFDDPNMLIKAMKAKGVQNENSSHR